MQQNNFNDIRIDTGKKIIKIFGVCIVINKKGV